MNMSFYSKTEECPFNNRDIKYFIENKSNRLWLSVDSLEGYLAIVPFVISLPLKELVYTNDPLKAIAHTNFYTASGWAYEHGIREEHLITEHEFIGDIV
jgi:hypothetical protein